MCLILGLAMYSICLPGAKRRLEKEKKEKEEAKKDKEGEDSYCGRGLSWWVHLLVRGKIQYTSPITPNSAFHIRNRMLSKLEYEEKFHVTMNNFVS